jgi:NAD(P)-dependent dehydrogenase (short-subunit alcohol dehydrogenase family)
MRNSRPADPAPSGDLSAFTLITGASRGIGRAIALEAARQGHALALVCHRERAKLDAVVCDAERAGSPRVFSYACDVSDADDVARVFADVVARGALTGLVNCAGYSGERAPLAEAPLAVIDRIIAINLRGTILCCRQAIPRMSRFAGAKGGAIVNLSSQNARFGSDRLTAYAASKAAIDGLTISLARETAPAGIRVNAVSPGAVLTEPLRVLPPEKLTAMQANLPMGRFCEPEEVAQTVLWLLSDAASYVSGAVVPVHGAR